MVIPVHLRSVKHDQQINPLIVSLIRRRHQEEADTLKNIHNNNIHAVLEDLEKRLKTIEVIENYLKIKIIRLEERNKKELRKIQEHHLEHKRHRKEKQHHHKRLLKNIKKDQHHLIEAAHRTHREEVRKLEESHMQINRMIKKVKENRKKFIEACRKNIHDFARIARNA